MKIYSSKKSKREPNNKTKEKQHPHEDKISEDLEQNKKILEQKLGLNSSFDVMVREMTIGGKEILMLYINGFAKDEVLTLILDRLTYLQPDQMNANALMDLYKRYVTHIQVVETDQMTDAINKVMAGETAIFIEGEHKAIVVDAKQLPSRSVDEPDLERVVRGSRDGFVETLLVNVTLIRRRLRDPNLTFEMVRIGERSQTDVCISYIRDIANEELLKSIRDRLKSIELDGLPLSDKQLEEALIKKGWNPYPLCRYSERPDVVAGHLLEGHIVLIVDTSPSVIILPTTIFHLVQHAEDYRQSPIVGTYLRWVRYFGVLASIFLLPLWYLMVIEPQIKPEYLQFVGPEKLSEIPLFFQIILVEIGVDLLRLAAVHTPTPLATALGLVATILIGQMAVDVGLFVTEVIIYMAVAAIGMFATPSYELGLANRLSRLILLILVAIFKIPGFVIGTTVILIILVCQRSHHTPYLWPFIPFNAPAFLQMFIRKPILLMNVRPSITKTKDNTRQPKSYPNDSPSDVSNNRNEQDSSKRS